MQHVLCLELVQGTAYTAEMAVPRLMYMLQATVKAFPHTSKASPSA